MQHEIWSSGIISGIVLKLDMQFGAFSALLAEITFCKWQNITFIMLDRTKYTRTKNTRTKYTWTKLSGQNILDKIYPDNIYRTICTGQNLPDKIYWTKYTGQNILDKIYCISCRPITCYTLVLGLWLGLWLGQNGQPTSHRNILWPLMSGYILN